MKLPWIGEVGRKYISSGDEVPITIQVATVGGDMEGELEDYSIYDNQSRAMHQFVWIYAAVTRIAETAAMIPFQVYTRKGENLTPEYDHEFEQLIREPSPHMSRFELWEQTLVHLELQGNAYWYLELAGGKPVQIEVIRPHQILPHPHVKKYID